jgi:predicted amidohydrolase
VQSACAAFDVAANAWSHATAVRAAQSRLVVFPELSLTGYDLTSAECRQIWAVADAFALVRAPRVGSEPEKL